MKQKTIKFLVTCSCLAILPACVPAPKPKIVIPAEEYSRNLRASNSDFRVANGMDQGARGRAAFYEQGKAPQPRSAHLRYVGGDYPEEKAGEKPLNFPVGEANNNRVTNFGPEGTTYEDFRNRAMIRDYTGPLNLGDPGVSASLFRENRGGSDLFRDDRAWQPMDLVTIVVSERSQGSNEADTEVKQKSSILASIENFLGFENDVLDSNTPPGTGVPNIDLTSLIKANTTNDFKGEGSTNRKDSLTAKISAMVVEVLPSGILRIEGQKIVSVNSEEKVMIISGLVRPKDVNSINEVSSAQIANMRIDYFGNGIVGEAQEGGWLARLVRRFWPF